MFCLSSEQQDWWWGQLLDRKKGIVVFTLLFALSSWEKNLAKKLQLPVYVLFRMQKIKKASIFGAEMPKLQNSFDQSNYLSIYLLFVKNKQSWALGKKMSWQRDSVLRLKKIVACRCTLGDQSVLTHRA